MTETYNQFLELLTAGDQEKMMTFLEAHFKELPEDFQDKITFALFEHTINEQLAQEEVLDEARKEGADIMKKLEAAKKIFEDAQKIAELKADL